MGARFGVASAVLGAGFEVPWSEPVWVPGLGVEKIELTGASVALRPAGVGIVHIRAGLASCVRRRGSANGAGEHEPERVSAFRPARVSAF